jgi:hypothetical protein
MKKAMTGGPGLPRSLGALGTASHPCREARLRPKSRPVTRVTGRNVGRHHGNKQEVNHDDEVGETGSMPLLQEAPCISQVSKASPRHQRVLFFSRGYAPCCLRRGRARPSI